MFSHNSPRNALASIAFRAQIKEDNSQMLTADDCNGVCLFLASDEAKWITGQVVEVEWFQSAPDE
ncbi:MAG: hypothetical protein HY872_13220 [Chloroflexi bacterium]|nr:hypothetical protein [Chloroflexota bacterium]